VDQPLPHRPRRNRVGGQPAQAPRHLPFRTQVRPRDAQRLARLARVDPELLHPIQHGSAQAQHDLLGLKLRAALVRTRVNLINAVRFTLKSLGHSVRNPSSESFHKTVLADIPADCLKGRTACDVFHDASQHQHWPKRQRQTIFRLLLQQFGAMLGETTNGRHPAPATVWRVTVESWLRCQGLITVRQNQKVNVSTAFAKCWSHN